MPGTVVEGVAVTAADLDRFARQIEVCPNGCWRWTGTPTGAGYGRIHVGGRRGRRLLAHRFALSITRGPITPGAVVMHSCDLRPCVCPEHVAEGTQGENIADAKAKGRMASGDAHGMRRHPERRASGERHGSARLTGEQVAAMKQDRAAGMTFAKLAARYSISSGHVADILAGRRWRAAS